MEITLGILTAFGGFVDISELVFAVQAGAKYGFALLWPIVIGTVGIILFSEMSGRVAAITQKPVFTIVKQIFPRNFAIFILITSTILNGLTCAAELGGAAIALQLLLGLGQLPALFMTLAGLVIFMWILPFKYIERTFGLLGLFLTIFLVTVFFVHINFGQVLKGFIPTLPHLNIPTYFYFAVGIISSAMMPYEVYFYSSGAIEEHWRTKDLLINRITASVGMTLGGFLDASLVILGAVLLKTNNIIPQLHGTSALMAAIPFGRIGLVIALLGIIFTVGGAAIETCLAGAYNIAQYFNWDWGLRKKPEDTPRFTIAWIVILIIAFFIIVSGIDPVQLVEYAVIFSVLVLPFTYYAVFAIARSDRAMGQYRTRTFGSILSWIYLFLVTIIAIVSVPLMIMTNLGQK